METKQLNKGTCFRVNNKYYKIYSSTKLCVRIISVNIRITEQKITKTEFNKKYPNAVIVATEDLNQKIFKIIEGEIVNLAEKITKTKSKLDRKNYQEKIKNLRAKFTKYCPEIITTKKKQ